MAVRRSSRLSIAAILAVLLVGGCSGAENGSPDAVGEQENNLATSPSAVEISFGQPGTVFTESGSVEYVIGKPEVVTFHEAEFDPNSDTATKPGKKFDPVVRVHVQIRGVSGEVPTGSEVQLTYEAADGTLAGETLPLATYEKTDPISNHPTTVSHGQKTKGEIFFESSDGGGKVIAEAAGRRQAIWRP